MTKTLFKAISLYMEGFRTEKSNRLTSRFYVPHSLPVLLSFVGIICEWQVKTALSSFGSLLALVFGFTTTISLFIFQQLSETDFDKHTDFEIENRLKLRYVFYASILSSVGSIFLVFIMLIDHLSNIFSMSFSLNTLCFNITIYPFSILFIFFMCLTLLIMIQIILQMVRHFDFKVSNHKD